MIRHWVATHPLTVSWVVLMGVVATVLRLIGARF